jgi:hypothetical protein
VNEYLSCYNHHTLGSELSGSFDEVENVPWSLLIEEFCEGSEAVCEVFC